MKICSNLVINKEEIKAESLKNELVSIFLKMSSFSSGFARKDLDI